MSFATKVVTPVISASTRTGMKLIISAKKLIISMQNSRNENNIGLFV